MSDTSFFEEQTEQSRIKAEIVGKYFPVWAGVIKPTVLRSNRRQLAYVDLFCGPGRYKDGSKSVPIRVLEAATADAFLRDHLVTVFNDADPNNISTLQDEISRLPNLRELKYKPQIFCRSIGDEIIVSFESARLVPTLSFIDPWGYKGLTLRLVNSVLKDWGCDVIFFFNYNRINMGLPNEVVRDHLNALFGEERSEHLRARVKGLRPHLRESCVIESLVEAITEMGGKYVLPFCFKNNTGTRTSHYLIFISKSFRGYDIMKGIMANSSSVEEQGVPSFRYCPADESMPLLFEFNRPLEELYAQLVATFAGQKIPMHRLYETHSVGRPFVRRNYVEVLSRMERDGLIRTNRPNRRANTLADEILIEFQENARGKRFDD